MEVRVAGCIHEIASLVPARRSIEFGLPACLHFIDKVLCWTHCSMTF